jgi:hypothetical protein
MDTPRKRTYWGHQCRQLADGYRVLKSPLAEPFSAAAEHYQESEPSADPPNKPDRSSAHDATR